MSATDELCRLLDERGVEWTYDGTVSFSDGKHWFHAWAYNDGAMCVSMGYLTPEQAIEATLGRGECEAKVEVVEFSQMQEMHRFTCSECGESFGAEEHGGLFGLVLDKVKLPNYCPNCGRKVRV